MELLNIPIPKVTFEEFPFLENINEKCSITCSYILTFVSIFAFNIFIPFHLRGLIEERESGMKVGNSRYTYVLIFNLKFC